MKKYLSILFVLSLTINTFVLAQESESEETEVSSVEALLMLVKDCLLYASPSPRD